MIDSYEKLTIKKYKEIIGIVNSDYSDIEKNTELVAVLNDMDVEDVEDLPIGTYHKLLQSTGFLYDEPKKRMIADVYRLGGYELVVMIDLKKMTIAQYIDYQEYVKNVNGNLSQLLSVFLIPKGKKYGDGYDIVKVQKAIDENMTIVDALSLSAFFLNLSQGLIKGTLSCLKRKVKWMKLTTRDKEKREKLQQVITNLETVGDGLRLLTEFQRR